MPSSKRKNPHSVIKEINSDVQQVYNETVHDIALNDYIKAKQNPDGGDPNWKYDRKNHEEIVKSNSFQNILKNTEKEAKYYREERAKLKRNLNECLGDDNPDYCQEKYNKAIEKLNKKDRFHGDFSNNLKDHNKQLQLEKNIDAIVQSKNLTNKEQKELYKKTEKYKNKKEQEIKDKVEHLEQVNTMFENMSKNANVNIDWFKNEGEDIKSQIEELKAKEITGDENIISKIKEIQNAKYTTQAEVDIAEARLKRLHEMYKDSVDKEVEERKGQIKSLASTYLNKQTELKDLQSTFGDYSKLNDKLHKDLEGMVNDQDKLEMYLKPSN